ncbi:MAG: lactonase family protein [Verrucomicrobia bacterium]|nr:lactonase family protein [Verrucomicrobiota bacterium]
MASQHSYDFRSSLLRSYCILGCVLFLGTPLSQAQDRWVYFGTYTGKNSQGIYVSRFDPRTGALSSPELAAESTHPSFLAIHPTRRFLYAVNEIGDFQGKKQGAVSSFAINPSTGKLSLLNQQPTGGGAPCHLVIDKRGGTVLVANYSGGSVSSFPVAQDGSLKAPASFIQHQGSGPNKSRQEAPHAHGIYLDPQQKWAAVPDLGLDRVLIHRFDPRSSRLVQHDAPLARLTPGCGPRHFAFHPTRPFGFSLNELDSTVTVLGWDSQRGQLVAGVSVSTLPAGWTGSSHTAEVFLHPNGRYLYASNRGHDTIAVFQVDRRHGSLTLIQHQSTEGRTPRGFGIDPDGRWLLAGSQGSDTVSVFSLNPKSGLLSPTGSPVKVGSPVCVEFLER